MDSNSYLQTAPLAAPIQLQEKASEPFWAKEPTILWKDTDSLLTFVPSEDFTRDENLNACSRFFLYLGLLTSLSNNKFRNFLLLGVIPCLVIYLIWQQEHPEEESIFGNLRLYLPRIPSVSTFTSLSDFTPPGPMVASKGNTRTPNKGNPYGVALRSMWNTRDAVLEAPDFLDDPKVAAEIDRLQSDWYDYDPTDVYQTKQGQRIMNFNPQPGTLVVDYDGKSRDWFYGLPEGYKSRKEGGTGAMPGRDSTMGKQVQDGWKMSKMFGM